MAKPMPMRGGRGMKGGPRPKAKKGTLKRLLKLLFKTNGKLLGVVFFCLVVSAVVSVSSSIFLENLIIQIGRGLIEGLDAVW
jgi:ATP-binding cassette subfamily B protein